MPAKKAKKDKVDKRRRARVDIGIDANGKTVWKYVSGKTDAEVQEKKKELLRLASRNAIGRADITVQDYAQEWVNLFIKPASTSATVNTYFNALNSHIIPAFGTRYLSAISNMELQRFVNQYAGCSSSIVDDIMLTLSRVFARAKIDGIIVNNPAEGMTAPRTVKNERRELTDAETEAVIKVIANHEEGLLFALLYYTGARRGEILGLQWQDIDWKNHTLRICRDLDFNDKGAIGDVKSAAANRLVPIPDPLYEMLVKVAGVGTAHIIGAINSPGKPISERSYNRMYDRLRTDMLNYDVNGEIERARSLVLPKDFMPGEPLAIRRKAARAIGEYKELPYAAITAHYFRHNYISILYAAGVPIEIAANWVGHADLNVTRNIYLHFQQKTQARHASSLLAFFNDKSGRKSESALYRPVFAPADFDK